MAFYTKTRIDETSPITDADMESGFSEYLSATIRDAWNDNPAVALADLGDIYRAQVGEEALQSLIGTGDDMSVDVSDFEYTASPALSTDEQKSMIEEAGLSSHLSPKDGYNREALSLVMERKKEELSRAMTRETASDWYAPAGFIAGLGVSMLDPINLASNFIPGVGQARALSMLQGAGGSALKRAGARAVIGAAEGLAGSAAVEPLVYLARSQQQADYDFTDSMLNLAFGTVMGGVMHPAVGAWGDYRRKMARQSGTVPMDAEPWETVAPTEETEALRADMVHRAYAAAREAGSPVTLEQVQGAAALFDARARTWAYFEGKSAEAYYEKWAPDFRAAADGADYVPPDVVDSIGKDLVPMGAEEESLPAMEAPAPEMAAKVPGRFTGYASSVLTPQGEDKAHYEIRDLSEIIASHDPEQGFARRADYPADAQERPYHSDRNEQEKVIRNALALDPRYLVNDNPDAVNGPPVITESGIVLGGNSRTMSLQLAYARGEDRAEAYRQALRDKANLFGIDASAVDAMERPVLVRVAEGIADEDMAIRSRLYNQSMTQGINRISEGVSRGRMVSPTSMDILSRGMDGGETLRAFFDTADGKRLTESLIRDGVLEQSQLGRLVDEKGYLTDEGKSLVEKTLRGLVIPDADLLKETPPFVLNKIDAIVPQVLRLKARGEGWDISRHVQEAVARIAEANKRGVGLDIVFGQGSLLYQDGPKPAVQAIAYTLKNATAQEVKLRFSIFADAAYKEEKGQTALLAPSITPAKSFVQAFLQEAAKVGETMIAGFNPLSRERDRAVLYAYNNGGRGKSVEAAEKKLSEDMREVSVGEKDRENMRAIMGQLSRMEGSVQIYPPKMGEFFSYREGDALFQPARKNVPDSVAYISNEDAQRMNLPGGGDFIARASDLEPVDRKHGEHFKSNGFESALDMVRYILEDVQAIYKAGGNAYHFVRPLTGRPGAVVAEFEGVPGEKRYRVTTVHPVRRNYFKNKTPLWESARLNRSEEPLAHISGQNGVYDEIIPQKEGNVNTLLQRAWHGTPHNFDAFTLAHIGSGEGAQAHGWGLYFAQDKDVSEGYREKLIEESSIVFGGRKYSDLDDNELPAWTRDDAVREQLENILDGTSSREDSIAVLKKYLFDEEEDARSYFDDEYAIALDEKLSTISDEDRTEFDEEKFRKRFEMEWWDEAEESRPSIAAYKDAIDFLSDYDNDLELINNNGQLFEVEIPENDVLLDEQKTFEEQPEKVKKALRKVREKAKEKQEELEAKLEEAQKTATSSFEDQINLKHLEALITNQYEIATMQLDGKVGDEIYRHMRRWMGSPRAASEALNSAGIKGITYDGRQDGRCFVVFDDKAIDIVDRLYQAMNQNQEAPRASVTFSPEDGKAVVEFFKNADATSLPHEMFHIFRRELMDTAKGEGASPKSRDMWAKACEFVGAKEGEAWTREQEEMFARAGERYLLEGKAPNVQLRGVFERMKQWFMEVYAGADASGMEISDTMRSLFGDMFRLSPEESDMAFRYAFGKMMEFDPSEGTDTAIRDASGMDDAAVSASLDEVYASRMEEAMEKVSDSKELHEEALAMKKNIDEEADASIAMEQLHGEILMEAALCDMRS